MLELRNITKSFMQGGKPVTVLRDVDLSIARGETLALVGPSGCGKTTLLQIAGLLDTADKGEIWLQGSEVSLQGDGVRTALRNRYLGFVYQFHHLLPECSALENVMIPQMIAGVEARAAHARAFELLAQLGLEERAHHRPGALSGGQMQRVAIARALANNPLLLLADEPTGNLDPESAEVVMEVLLAAVAHHGTALVMVTHNEALAARMDAQATLHQGTLLYYS